MNNQYSKSKLAKNWGFLLVVRMSCTRYVQPAPSMMSLVCSDPSKMVCSDPPRMVCSDPYKVGGSLQTILEGSLQTKYVIDGAGCICLKILCKSK